MTRKEMFYLNLKRLKTTTLDQKEAAKKRIESLHSKKLTLYTKVLRLIENELEVLNSQTSLTLEEIKRKKELMERQVELLEKVDEIDWEIQFAYRKQDFIDERRYTLFKTYLLILQRKHPSYDFGFPQGIVGIIPKSQIELGGNPDKKGSFDIRNWQKNLTETYQNAMENQTLSRKFKGN